MARKCFISFKTEDLYYKKKIQELPKIEIIDKSLNVAIDSENEDYILSTIRKDYLSDSTVTIHLIGLKSAESLGWDEQKFIKRELQASLYNGLKNTRNGILGVVVPEAYHLVFKGSYNCSTCGGSHNYVNVADVTVKEFSYNYYIPNGKCAHTDDERYCILVKWEDFIADPNAYIEMAFEKREHPIASKVKVYPK